MNATLAEEVVWRLEDLYRGTDASEIEADKQACRTEAQRFASTYKGRVAELAPQALLEAIREYEVLQERAQRLLAFGYLTFATQTADSRASALWQALQEFYSLLHRDTLFFELEWTQLDGEAAAQRSADPALAPYRHYLEALRRYRPHLLSEAEERLLAE